MAQVFLMLKGDGSPWFSLEISIADRFRFQSEVMNNESEALSMWYQNPGTNENLAVDFYDTGIPIIPHSWYHVCLGLDTESGLLRIVVNGIKVVDEEKQFFRNTSAWKPQSLAGKLLMFKSYTARFWSQNRGKFSNMNIFSSMMSLEDMMMRTSGYSDCTGPGDYTVRISFGCQIIEISGASSYNVQKLFIVSDNVSQAKIICRRCF